MAEKSDPFNAETSADHLKTVLAGINSQYEDVTITKVNGKCPYGHTVGEKHTITSMNTDGLCGSLFANIVPSVFTTHYGGGLPWEKETGVFRGLCPEQGIVEVEVRRIKKGDAKVIKTKKEPIAVTGIGFDAIDKYRLYLEILGIERHCTYGHVAGQKVEVDPFNTGNICGFLYWSAYRFMNLLLKGGRLPWEAEPHIIHGVCPDPRTPQGEKEGVDSSRNDHLWFLMSPLSKGDRQKEINRIICIRFIAVSSRFGSNRAKGGVIWLDSKWPSSVGFVYSVATGKSRESKRSKSKSCSAT